MDKEKFQKYAQLKLDAVSIDAQIKALAPEIVTMMEEGKADKVKSELGTFNLAPFRTYQYSNKVKEVETEVKRLKEVEKADGTATFTEVNSLKFFVKKDA